MEKIKEPTIIFYIRVPISWHRDLKKIADEVRQDMGSLLRPYIYLAVKDIKNKFEKGEAV